MKVKIEISGTEYSCNLDEGQDISIPFGHEEGPIAFNAPPVALKPYTADGFIGSLEAGSPVNFYNLKINPHGNCTHTETALHINKTAPTVYDVLRKHHHIARLITVSNVLSKGESDFIGESSYDWKAIDFSNIDALIIRTLPNGPGKKTRNYTNSNPVFLDHELVGYLSRHIDHLFVDFPSVDPEKDGGKLRAHKAFWSIDENPAFQKTITEMVYVDSIIKDGIYLLELQTLAIKSDASPSRPVIYTLNIL